MRWYRLDYLPPIPLPDPRALTMKRRVVHSKILHDPSALLHYSIPVSKPSRRSISCLGWGGSTYATTPYPSNTFLKYRNVIDLL